MKSLRIKHTQFKLYCESVCTKMSLENTRMSTISGIHPPGNLNLNHSTKSNVNEMVQSIPKWWAYWQREIILHGATPLETAGKLFCSSLSGFSREIIQFKITFKLKLQYSSAHLKTHQLWFHACVKVNYVTRVAWANELSKQTRSKPQCPSVHFWLGICPPAAAADTRDGWMYHPQVHVASHPVIGSHAVYLVLTGNV